MSHYFCVKWGPQLVCPGCPSTADVNTLLSPLCRPRPPEANVLIRKAVWTKALRAHGCNVQITGETVTLCLPRLFLGYFKELCFLFMNYCFPGEFIRWNDLKVHQTPIVSRTEDTAPRPRPLQQTVWLKVGFLCLHQSRAWRKRVVFEFPAETRSSGHFLPSASQGFFFPYRWKESRIVLKRKTRGF